ncbi:MAG: HPF/RaiA family ribosome-associated protein [Rhodospirillaceae bacterium]|nr:HPF/RaiA family ribosome-associated protein [Rhodospirillaceae bacterium]
MDQPAQISFHGLDHSDAVEQQVRARLAKLDQIFDHITSCRVVIESQHEAHSHLNKAHRPFQVAIQLGVPGDELVVNRGKKDMVRHINIDAAIRDSFAVMERQLKEYVRKRWRDKRKASA